MSALDAANRYFEAWNDRNASAILASLTEDGTYQDPLTGPPISGEALRSYAEALWLAFPDLRFEVASKAETGAGRVVAEWIMKGTNTGSFRGLPPTGNRVEARGSDFIDTESDKVRSVVGYFDSAAVPRQLGMAIIVQPNTVGPFRFGVSTEIRSGRNEKPGAISVTQLEAIDEDAAIRIRDMARATMIEMREISGFIGATTARFGNRLVTISAWDDADAPKQLMAKRAHVEAQNAFFRGELASSAYTSVWEPVRINPFWVRCVSCNKMRDTSKVGSTCSCGASIPEHPPYW